MIDYLGQPGLMAPASEHGADISLASPVLRFFFKPAHRLLLYGSYCSQVEMATKHLDKLSSQREDIRMKLEVRRTETRALLI